MWSIILQKNFQEETTTNTTTTMTKLTKMTITMTTTSAAIALTVTFDLLQVYKLFHSAMHSPIYCNNCSEVIPDCWRYTSLPKYELLRTVEGLFLLKIISLFHFTQNSAMNKRHITMAQKHPRASASRYESLRTLSMRLLYTILSLCSWTKARTVRMLASRSSATC